MPKERSVFVPKMITHRKIAALAGVSPATVSKALSHSTEISPETVARIEQLARENGYYSGIRERRQEYNKKYVPRIVILVPEIISVFYSDTATGIADEIEHLGGRATIGITGFDKKKLLGLFEEYAWDDETDGIVVLNQYYQGMKSSVPVVFLNSECRECPYDVIGVIAGADIDIAYEHLSALGHTDIGYLGEKHTSQKNDAYAKQRQKSGADPEKFCFISEKRFEQAGYDGVSALCSEGRLPTALVCAYDEIALGAVRELKLRGLGVPGDVSVIGINDIPFSSYAGVPLTTISNFSAERRKLAAKLLMEKVYHPESRMVQHIGIKGELVIRETTAPPAKMPAKIG